MISNAIQAKPTCSCHFGVKNLVKTHIDGTMTKQKIVTGTVI